MSRWGRKNPKTQRAQRTAAEDAEGLKEYLLPRLFIVASLLSYFLASWALLRSLGLLPSQRDKADTILGVSSVFGDAYSLSMGQGGRDPRSHIVLLTASAVGRAKQQTCLSPIGSV